MALFLASGFGFVSDFGFRISIFGFDSTTCMDDRWREFSAMIPLVDMHCHLLAGLDDGPRTMEAALEMCAIAYQEGVRLMAAGAHQNERWAKVTPAMIRDAVRDLEKALAQNDLAMSVFPCAEVTAHPETVANWRAGKLLSVADRNQYLLLEMPHGVFVDLLPTARRLREQGVRPILAHPEREERFLHEPGEMEAMIDAGCLVQVSSHGVTDPKTSADERALKDWFRRGIVHFLGSDGHSPHRRPPHLAAAYRRIADWVGPAQADRIASGNGLAVVHGLPLSIPRPAPRGVKRWWSSLVGSAAH
jgi:protein-tyrosine phosphatase